MPARFGNTLFPIGFFILLGCITTPAPAAPSDPAAMPALGQFAQGTQEYPDRSTTLILQLPALDGGDALTFEGPGIRTRATIAPLGLPENFAEDWRANRARLPRGVDLILTAGDAIACLPRSARLVREGS